MSQAGTKLLVAGIDVGSSAVKVVFIEDGGPADVRVLAADVERDLAGRVGLRPLVEPRQLFLRDDERAVGLRIFHGNVPDL